MFRGNEPFNRWRLVCGIAVALLLSITACTSAGEEETSTMPTNPMDEVHVQRAAGDAD